MKKLIIVLVIGYMVVMGLSMFKDHIVDSHIEQQQNRIILIDAVVNK